MKSRHVLSVDHITQTGRLQGLKINDGHVIQWSDRGISIGSFTSLEVGTRYRLIKYMLELVS